MPYSSSPLPFPLPALLCMSVFLQLVGRGPSTASAWPPSAAGGQPQPPQGWACPPAALGWPMRGTLVPRCLFGCRFISLAFISLHCAQDLFLLLWPPSSFLLSLLARRRAARIIGRSATRPALRHTPASRIFGLLHVGLSVLFVTLRGALPMARASGSPSPARPSRLVAARRSASEPSRRRGASSRAPISIHCARARPAAF